MNVAEILSHKGHGVTTVSPDATIAEAVNLLGEHRIGALVVSRTGTSIDGVLSERDIVRALATSSDAAPLLTRSVHTAMSTTVRTCAPEDRIESLRIMMTEHRIRHLPVRDDHGELCGIVSIGDVVKSRVNELEVEHDQLVSYVRGGQ